MRLWPTVVRELTGPAVVVPGSSANLGPGFDVLAMAVGVHVRMGVGPRIAPGSDVDELSDKHPARVAFLSAGGRGDVWFESNIPSGRGLGFSGAAIVAGTIVGMISRENVGAPDVDAFIDRHRDEILDRAATIEGHPDNVAASLHGGVIAVADRTVIDLPVGFDARLAVWVPASSTSTAKSRATLGRTVDRDDAVFNLGRVLLFAEGLRSGDRRLLRTGTNDRLHQDARLAAAPRSKAALRAFEECGAIAAWLSGSGSSVAALSTVDESSVVVERVREAMGNDDGRVMELTIDVSGARQAT